jgi:hypothetical protein
MNCHICGSPMRSRKNPVTGERTYTCTAVSIDTNPEHWLASRRKVAPELATEEPKPARSNTMQPTMGTLEVPENARFEIITTGKDSQAHTNTVNISTGQKYTTISIGKDIASLVGLNPKGRVIVKRHENLLLIEPSTSEQGRYLRANRSIPMPAIGTPVPKQPVPYNACPGRLIVQMPTP